LELALSDYQDINVNYVGTYTPASLDMTHGLNGFFFALSCDLPEPIWLTGVVVQVPEHKFMLEGFMREKINLYD